MRDWLVDPRTLDSLRTAAARTWPCDEGTVQRLEAAVQLLLAAAQE